MSIQLLFTSLFIPDNTVSTLQDHCANSHLCTSNQRAPSALVTVELYLCKVFTIHRCRETTNLELWIFLKYISAKVDIGNLSPHLRNSAILWITKPIAD